MTNKNVQEICLPVYTIVVLSDFGQSLLPQRVYTAPPVTPSTFPFSPFTPVGPGSPRFPGGPAKTEHVLLIFVM